MRKHRGVAEAYQVAILLCGLLWLALVRGGPDVLQSLGFKALGIAVVAYFVLELFVFCLYWIFVSGPVASSRRSLAMFFVNIFELSILFAIASQLLGCLGNQSALSAFYDHLSGIFRLGLVGVDNGAVCKVAGHAELVVAVTLMTIVIAGAIGAAIPPQRAAERESVSRTRPETNTVPDIKILGSRDQAILANVAPGVFDKPLNRQLLNEFLGDERHHLIVAIHQDQVIGFASGVHYVHPDKPAEMWINEVGVAPSHRGRGVGKAIIQELLQHAERLGCREAWVLTDRANHVAMGLYASIGGQEAPHDQVMFTFLLDGTKENARATG